jgi:hypothetical protein
MILTKSRFVWFATGAFAGHATDTTSSLAYCASKPVGALLKEIATEYVCPVSAAVAGGPDGRVRNLTGVPGTNNSPLLFAAQVGPLPF